MVLKFPVTHFIFQPFVRAAVRLRGFHVGEGDFSRQLFKRRETHRQVSQSNGCHQEPKGEGVDEIQYAVTFLSVNTRKDETVLCC